MYATSFLECLALLCLLPVQCQRIFFKSISNISGLLSLMSKNIRLRVLLVSVLVLLFSTNQSMALPVRNRTLNDKTLNTKSSLRSSGRSSLKYINPCRLSTHPLDYEKVFAEFPAVPKQELYENVMSRAKVASNHGQLVLQAFLNEIFKDSHFENGVKSQRQEWLPNIPHSSEESFRKFNVMQSFTISFEYLQYFAIGIEQIILDQILNDGFMIEKFKDIEYDLLQLMCELELAMYWEHIEPNTDVTDLVMSQQYRDINEKSLRNLRDYLILRDYVSATNFIADLFAYHKSRIING